MLSSMTVTSSSGMAMGSAFPCDGVPTTRVVPAGGTLEEAVELGRMTVASYTYEVGFDHRGSSASGTFEVR
ncbi:MAG: hypothetical protein EXR69_13465 [Myxococcales bacterium]|nr:hypothetical protein [Myxococcales bacterium]